MPLMPAVVVNGIADVEIKEVPVPKPEKGKVLVKMAMASICGTDLHYVFHGWPKNSYPLEPGEPGHEGIGRVIDGGETEFQEGELVLTVPNIWQARNFAGYQLIYPHFLVRLPEGPNPSHLLMAQQLGTVIFAARKLPSVEGKTVVVLGQGSAGLFHDFWLRRAGASRIIVVEPNDDRRSASLALDVDDAVQVTGSDAVDAVAELIGANGADIVVDAVGGVETLNQSVAMLRPEGHLHLFGLPTTHDLVGFDLGAFFLKRLDMGTIFGAQDEPGLVSFKQALDLIVNEEIDMSPYVTHTLPIEQAMDAFNLARYPRDGALKVSISME